jgi:predicted metalloprotease with PDZ domain
MRFVQALALLIAAPLCAAQPIPEPTRSAYPGTITISVDATDTAKRIFRVRESIPVQPGPLTLLYPQWIPGNHAPTGLITLLAGMTFTAAGRPIEWRRNSTNMYAFHLDVPSGVDRVDAEFQFLSPLQPVQGRVVMTPDMLGMQWHAVILYPAGVHSDGIRMLPDIKLPPGWQFASSLEVESQAENRVQFRPTSLTELVDSPVWAGANVKRAELEADGGPPVRINAIAELPENLNMEPEQVAAFRSMVQQSYKLFGPPPYRRYEFLLGLSESFSRIALEHQQSTELGVAPGFFTKWKSLPSERGNVTHEFVHVWNGKLHRPVELATPNYNVLMANDLLWAYEGQTEYWAEVLGARGGMLTQEQTMQVMARIAAYLTDRTGRSWRNLQDTGNEPIMRYDRARNWTSWQRGVDYYGEGVFLWMEVDARIRELTDGKRSLDDFARTFFARRGDVPKTISYSRADLVKALNDVAPEDWGRYLQERLESKTRNNAGEALKAVGWRLTFKEKPSDYADLSDKENSFADFLYSLGFVVGKGDAIAAVQWDSPAFKAGMAAGATLLAVNGRAYKSDLLKNAITAAKESKQPIQLLLKTDDLYRTVSIAWDQGLRYPHLERIPDVPDRLSTILEPLP